MVFLKWEQTRKGVVSNQLHHIFFRSRINALRRVLTKGPDGFWEASQFENSTSYFFVNLKTLGGMILIFGHTPPFSALLSWNITLSNS